MATPSLHWVDYLIFTAFMLVSIGIGIYHSLTGGKQKTTQEFIMADRKLKVIPTMMSMVASFYSAIAMLGSTAEFYNWGIQHWILFCLSNFIGKFLAMRFIVPWLYPLRLTSAFEYLQMRFKSRAVELLGTFVGVLKQLLYMGVAIYAPSIALEAACGFPAKASIPLMALICTTYTAMGGMRAVIWTDVFQLVIYIGGMLTILIRGAVVVGGLGNALKEAGKHGRLEFNTVWDVNPSVRHTLWGFLIGNSILQAILFGVNQASVQRYSATKSLRHAQWVVILYIPSAILMYSVACITGILVLGYYSIIECDPLFNGDVTSSNQILTHFVQSVFKDAIGFSGLFLATLYSGALSSVSSAQSGAAANTWENLFKFILPNLEPSRAALVNKMLVVFYGFVSVGVAFLASTMPGTVMQIAHTFGGAVSGPLFGIYFLGGVSTFVEWKGALSGGLAGFLLMLWILIGAKTVPRVNDPYPPLSTAGCPVNNLTDFTPLPQNHTFADVSWKPYDLDRVHGFSKLYTVSYNWYAFIGALACIVVAFAVSAFCRYVLKEKPQPVTPQLLIPWKAGLGLESFPGDREKVDILLKPPTSKLEKENGAITKKQPEEDETKTSDAV